MTITEGNVLEVSASGIYQMVVNLTSTTAICFYVTLDDAVLAKHLTLSGSNITAGAELTVDGTAVVSAFKLIRATRLTDTSVLVAYSVNGNIHKAGVVSVSGTTLTAHTFITLSDTANIRSNSIDAITSTSCMYVYGNSGGTGKAVVLTLSGTTVTENALFTFDTNCFNVAVAVLSATKSVVAFVDASNSNRVTGEVLNLAGTTITGNADVQLSANAGETSIYYKVAIASLDSTHVIVGWNKSSPANFVESVVAVESGSSLTPGSGTTGAARDNGSIVALSGSRAIFFSGHSVLEYSISGTTITEDDTVTISDFTTTSVGWITNLTATNMIASGDSSNSEVIPIFVDPAISLTLSSIPKPASVDASGTFIYLALLNNGTPILSKFSTALDADGTTVFDPGAGDAIGVECARFNADVIWIAGNFDGTNVVEKSEDAGVSFVVKDNAAIGDIRAFAMGPDSDDKLLVFDETNGDILETRDDGATWITINAAVTPEINAIARLGENVQESVFGNDGGANNSINYSINSGDDLEDFQTGVYPNANATGVIVN